MITHHFAGAHVWGLGQISKTVQIPNWLDLLQLLREAFDFEYLGDLRSIRNRASEHLDMWLSQDAYLKHLSPTWHFVKAPDGKVWAIGCLPSEFQSGHQEALGNKTSTFRDDDNFLPVRNLHTATAYFRDHAHEFARGEIRVETTAEEVVLLGIEPGYELHFHLTQHDNAMFRPWDTRCSGHPKGGVAMGTPIETAAELYREMKKRGLHLRRQNGRDNVLIAQLANKVGCTDLNLQAFLDRHSELSAQDFMILFIDIAQPFATMFTEIWDYLSTYAAYRSSESIAVRFGYPDSKDQSVITLEQFRRYVERIRRTILTVHLWPDDAIYSLYGLYRILLKKIGSGVGRHKYQEGQAYTLPKLAPAGHPFDEIAIRIHRLFQKNVDAFAEEGRLDIAGISLKSDAAIAEGSRSGFPTRRLTADLLPFWQRVFEEYGRVADETKGEALEYYTENTDPLLGERKEEGTARFTEALDIIDLPFWRHRWHTYEVWATVAVLRALREYRPIPQVKEGCIPIDGYLPSIVAYVDADGFPKACVAVQVQTPYVAGKRKGIKPDLRVCFSDPQEAAATGAIVEFKQREQLPPEAIREVATAYLGGSPKCGGLIIVNYDAVSVNVQLPRGASLIGEMHPCNRTAVTAFQDALLMALESVSFRPVKKNIVVLLDISGSMAGEYKRNGIQDTLGRLLSMTAVSVFTFNDGLTSAQQMGADSNTVLDTSGGTNLGKALDDLEEGHGVPDRLLVVTDGEYKCPKGRLERIPSVRECAPGDLENNIQWLWRKESV